MDSALITALGTALGAVVGSGATIGMGLLSSRTSRQQAQLQARMQMRDPRRDAYAEFLRAYRSLLDDLQEAYNEHTRGGAATLLSDAIDQHRGETMTAHSRVAVEGPDAVVAAADAAIGAASKLQRDALFHDLGSRFGQGSMNYEDIGRISIALTAFTTAARKAVDIRP